MCWILYRYPVRRRPRRGNWHPDKGSNVLSNRLGKWCIPVARPSVVYIFPSIFPVKGEYLRVRHVKLPFDQINGFAMPLKRVSGREAPQELRLTLQTTVQFMNCTSILQTSVVDTS